MIPERPAATAIEPSLNVTTRKRYKNSDFINGGNQHGHDSRTGITPPRLKKCRYRISNNTQSTSQITIIT